MRVPVLNQRPYTLSDLYLLVLQAPSSPRPLLSNITSGSPRVGSKTGNRRAPFDQSWMSETAARVKQRSARSAPGQCLNRHCRRILTIARSVSSMGYSPKSQRNSVLCKSRRLVNTRATVTTVERCLGRLGCAIQEDFAFDPAQDGRARAGIPLQSPLIIIRAIPLLALISGSILGRLDLMYLRCMRQTSCSEDVL